MYNPLDEDLPIEYNSKMCYLNDAKNWSGLSDVHTITIPQGQSKTIFIKENWFATSIAISYKNNDRRIITYADGLKKDGSINVYNNYI